MTEIPMVPIRLYGFYANPTGDSPPFFGGGMFASSTDLWHAPGDPATTVPPGDDYSTGFFLYPLPSGGADTLPYWNFASYEDAFGPFEDGSYIGVIQLAGTFAT